MLFPGVRLRRKVRERLEKFYAEYQDPDFAEALRLLAEFYDLPVPKIHWYEKIDNGRSLGMTDDDGTISLVHPENWKQMKACPATKTHKGFQPTCAFWVTTVLHEWNHYMNAVDDERKADLYARKFVTGLTA